MTSGTNKHYIYQAFNTILILNNYCYYYTILRIQKKDKDINIKNKLHI